MRFIILLILHPCIRETVEGKMNTASRVCVGLFLIAHTLLFILAVIANGAVYFHFMCGASKEFELETGKYVARARVQTDDP
jgi:hypothetical protein